MLMKHDELVKLVELKHRITTAKENFLIQLKSKAREKYPCTSDQMLECPDCGAGMTECEKFGRYEGQIYSCPNDETCEAGYWWTWEGGDLHKGYPNDHSEDY